MKKLFLNMGLLLLSASSAFSQSDEEKRLNIIPMEQLKMAAAPSGNVDCKCQKNILADGGFENVTTLGGIGNISPTSSPWKPDTNTPQWSAINGACNKGIVSMWGNQTVGESIVQNGLSIVAGKKYRVKFTAMFANPTSLSTFVKLKIFGYNGTGPTGTYNSSSNVIGISPNITSTSWATYTFPDWTAPTNLNSIQLHPENGYTQNDGAYVSWIRLDNICIEEVSCPCDSLPKQLQITGPQFLCYKKDCNTVLTYTVPNYGSKECYTYNWTVSGGTSPVISGQGTNQIQINCKDLKPGSYKITVTIKCGDKVVTQTIPLIVCETPNPAFTLTTTGAGATVTPTPPGATNHYWYIVTDTDNNCGYTAGEIFNYAGSTGLTGANFSSLVNNQQYAIYHYAYNNCGQNSGCWSLQVMCFKWLPPVGFKMAPGASVDLKPLSQRLSESVSDIPAEFKKNLPKEMYDANVNPTDKKARWLADQLIKESNQ